MHLARMTPSTTIAALTVVSIAPSLAATETKKKSEDGNDIPKGKQKAPSKNKNDGAGTPEPADNRKPAKSKPEPRVTKKEAAGATVVPAASADGDAGDGYSWVPIASTIASLLVTVAIMLFILGRGHPSDEVDGECPL